MVLVGGETAVSGSSRSHILPSESRSAQKESDSSKKEKEPSDSRSEHSSSEETNNNRCLNDVWVYDLYLRVWQEIKPQIKVQSVFNNKKMRKTFEPRMAHSATIIHDNYLVCFGGYSTQKSSYLNSNFAVLSLSGCTDYILSKNLTYKETLALKDSQIEPMMKSSTILKDPELSMQKSLSDISKCEKAKPGRKRKIE